ncbi:hypothetical protein [Arenimonas oryziterrae]|uniref:hypothetical protein n=1 Tax=Arenimonas oryziterrae TaxID=498055 RepID=UPI0012DEA8E5|nr:hypothetical protein [Arenimonas oryziterrae]
MNRIASLAVLVFFLVSCMGDSTMFVSGRIVDERGQAVEGCSVSLYLVAANRQLVSRAVSGKWREDFVVSPRPREYYIGVACASGLAGKTAKFQFPLDEGGGQNRAVDFGEIVVR